MGANAQVHVEGRQHNKERSESMTALMGTALYIVAILTAGWMGYMLGFDGGVRHEKTKRGIRKW